MLNLIHTLIIVLKSNVHFTDHTGPYFCIFYTWGNAFPLFHSTFKLLAKFSLKQGFIYYISHYKKDSIGVFLYSEEQL